MGKDIPSYSLYPLPHPQTYHDGNVAETDENATSSCVMQKHDYSKHWKAVTDALFQNLNLLLSFPFLSQQIFSTVSK